MATAAAEFERVPGRVQRARDAADDSHRAEISDHYPRIGFSPVLDIDVSRRNVGVENDPVTGKKLIRRATFVAFVDVKDPKLAKSGRGSEDPNNAANPNVGGSGSKDTVVYFTKTAKHCAEEILHAYSQTNAAGFVVLDSLTAPDSEADKVDEICAALLPEPLPATELVPYLETESPKNLAKLRMPAEWAARAEQARVALIASANEGIAQTMRRIESIVDEVTLRNSGASQQGRSAFSPGDRRRAEAVGVSLPTIIRSAVQQQPQTQTQTMTLPPELTEFLKSATQKHEVFDMAALKEELKKELLAEMKKKSKADSE